jgi:hypothetical protein
MRGHRRCSRSDWRDSQGGVGARGAAAPRVHATGISTASLSWSTATPPSWRRSCASARTRSGPSWWRRAPRMGDGRRRRVVEAAPRVGDGRQRQIGRPTPPGRIGASPLPTGRAVENAGGAEGRRAQRVGKKVARPLDTFRRRFGRRSGRVTTTGLRQTTFVVRGPMAGEVTAQTFGHGIADDAGTTSAADRAPILSAWKSMPPRSPGCRIRNSSAR